MSVLGVKREVAFAGGHVDGEHAVLDRAGGGLKLGFVDAALWRRVRVCR